MNSMKRPALPLCDVLPLLATIKIGMHVVLLLVQLIVQLSLLNLHSPNNAACMHMLLHVSMNPMKLSEGAAQAAAAYVALTLHLLPPRTCCCRLA
jgi:hypothetical protein